MELKAKPYPKNAKKHSDAQLKLIAASLKEFGWQQPIVVDKNNEIIVGHGRYFAYQKYPEGIEKPWIQKADKLTPAQVKAYRLADNKLNESEWDMDLAIEELTNLDKMGVDISLLGFNPLIINGEFNFKNMELNPETIEHQAGEHKTRPCPNCGFEF